MVRRYTDGGAPDHRDFRPHSRHHSRLEYRRTVSGNVMRDRAGPALQGIGDTTPGAYDANPVRDSGVGSPAQALELAPEPLARPALAPDSHDPRSHLGDDRRRGVVLVARRSHGCSDTRLDRVHDLHDTVTIGDQRLDPVAGANLRRRLGQSPIHADVTALAQSRRKRAGLHQAHGTEPAIDARLGGSARVSHVDKGRTPRPRGHARRNRSCASPRDPCRPGD